MKEILHNRNLTRRFGYHGWVVEVDGYILNWTFSTTREECRQCLDELRNRRLGDLFKTKWRVIKAKVEVVEAFK